MASIAVDATFVRPGAVGGAQQMLENVVEALDVVAAPLDNEIVVVGSPSQGYRDQYRCVRWIGAPAGTNRFVQSWRFGNASTGYDAVLFPNYFTPPIRRGRTRVVTVIHDLQYRAFPGTFSRTKRMWLLASHRHTLYRADVVVVISEHVRADVLSAYGRRWEDKVVSIPNPISWDRFRIVNVHRARSAVPAGRYILSVCAQYAHKNLATLLDAFSILRTRSGFEDVVLVLAGQWSDKLVGIAHVVDLRGQVARLGLQNAVRFTGFVDDEIIGALYQHASAFVFPSLFEGFGMPAVEALGFGLPVLTTRRTALPETTLGLATYLEDPLDANEMADAMKAMLDTPARFRPADAEVARVRETYSLRRIGRMYRDSLLG